jgi:hypothetical protein
MSAPKPVTRLVGHDEDGHLRDSLDRRHPTRFNLVWAFRAVPGLAEQFETQVPGSYWAITGEGEATVSCPCGEAPAVGLGKIAECKCERFYLYVTGQVRVANSPVGEKAPAEEVETRESLTVAQPEELDPEGSDVALDERINEPRNT